MVSICFLVALSTVTATDVSFEHESITTMPDEIVTHRVVTSTNEYTIYPVEVTTDYEIIERTKSSNHWKWLQKHHTQQAKLRTPHRSPTHWMRTRGQLCLDYRVNPSLQLIITFIIVIL